MRFPRGYDCPCLPTFLLNLVSSLAYIHLVQAYIHLVIWLLPSWIGFGEPEISALQDFYQISSDVSSACAHMIRERLPLLRFGNFAERLGETEEIMCAVCLSSFEEDDEIRELCNCCHIFHSSCLDKWIDLHQDTCPLCRCPLLLQRERVDAEEGNDDSQRQTKPFWKRILRWVNVNSNNVNFQCRSVLDRDPTAEGPASLGTHGPAYVQKWIGLQLAPISNSGVLPDILEEVTTHAVPLPFLLVRGDYDKVYNFFWTYGKAALDAAEQQFGLKREEACHNLLFFVCFNTFGGMFVLFPSIIKHIGVAGKELHANLAEEVRAAIKENNGLNMRALESMALLRSTVYEVLRIDPPVQFQYGHAKEDLVVESHDGRYAVKKGEMLGGYQPFATRDPKVFDNPEEFLPRRFMGEEGEKLLKYVLWSNGRETEQTTVQNKQCAAKDFVVMISRLLVAQLFVHYDSFEIDTSSTSKVVFTSLQNATS